MAIVEQQQQPQRRNRMCAVGFTHRCGLHHFVWVRNACLRGSQVSCSSFKVYTTAAKEDRLQLLELLNKLVIHECDNEESIKAVQDFAQTLPEETDASTLQDYKEMLRVYCTSMQQAVIDTVFFAHDLFCALEIAKIVGCIIAQHCSTMEDALSAATAIQSVASGDRLQQLAVTEGMTQLEEAVTAMLEVL